MARAIRSNRFLFFLMLFLLTQVAAASADDRLHQLTLPPGFHITLYASVPGARSMALDEKTGVVFVGTRRHSVFAVLPGTSLAQGGRVVRLLDNLDVPNGIAIHDGYLYVAEQPRIVRFPLPKKEPTERLEGSPQVIYSNLPNKAHHGWRYMAFGPDDKLYVTVGSPCNICADEGVEGTILQMNADGSQARVFASGIRNSVGLDFQPDSGTLFFTDNGTDTMGDDVPPDELNAAPQAGLFFGFPYYAGGHARYQGWDTQTPPQSVTFPVVAFQAHTASLAVRFYTGTQFPQEYRHDAFVAQHGSWNRSIPIGYRIMRVHFNEEGKVVGKSPFVSGWLQNGRAWGRPVDILQMPDGALLVSDDYGGRIYRIAYGTGTSDAQ